ncbi:MAG: radical SAM protein [Pseudomonadota bacterium]
MINVLLIQLPTPRLNFGLKTGNIPLGAACLKQSAAGIPGCSVDIVPEAIASYASDRALIRYIVDRRPDILGFTVYCWNLERSLYVAEQVRQTIRTRIVFGGPEITPDNDLIRSEAVDVYVYGEGEAAFRSLLTCDALWIRGQASGGTDTWFAFQPSPYVSGYLQAGLENLMLLETQRGCPYRCGFCFYSKSRKSVSCVQDQAVLDGVAWAVDNDIEEIYLLDPSLNSRPGLEGLLEKISDLNSRRQVPLISEIRAEAVDARLGELFRRAGFTGFEVGLQSTNPPALRMMNRPTNLDAFLKGARQLKDRGIVPTVDLIYGLPGDTLAGFTRTLEFVRSNGLHDAVQVFPLLVLPGTEFRKKSREMGLVRESRPPYTVISTPTFSDHEMVLALDAAEDLFDMTLCTFPDLEVSFRAGNGDVSTTLENGRYVSKLILATRRSLDEIRALSEKITSPFQVFFGPGITDPAYEKAVLKCLSENNPFTPMEIVFLEPGRLPDADGLLSVMATRRPHFLDHDLRYLYPEPGNRAVQFTLVSLREDLVFDGPMKRQVHLWDRDSLPRDADFEGLSHLDGIMIESDLPLDILHEWQDRIARIHEEILAVNFAHVGLQTRWMALTCQGRYVMKVLEPRGAAL